MQAYTFSLCAARQGKVPVITEGSTKLNKRTYPRQDDLSGDYSWIFVNWPVCDLTGKYKRNKIFVNTTRQSTNHPRALQVDRNVWVSIY